MNRALPTWLAGLVIALLAGAVLMVGGGFLGSETEQRTGTATTPATEATDPVDDTERSGIPACDPALLPATTQEVIEDVEAGGPFEHPRHDGGRFGNYEGILPDEELGYYREYTVETPGLDHRGARRIVTGGADADDPDVWFYTDDHYESFCELDPAA